VRVLVPVKGRRGCPEEMRTFHCTNIINTNIRIDMATLAYCYCVVTEQPVDRLTRIIWEVHNFWGSSNHSTSCETIQYCDVHPLSVAIVSAVGKFAVQYYY